MALFEANTATSSFAYTIGLWTTYGHPEVTCFGLPINTLGAVLNDVGDLVKAGQQISLDTG